MDSFTIYITEVDAGGTDLNDGESVFDYESLVVPRAGEYIVDTTTGAPTQRKWLVHKVEHRAGGAGHHSKLRSIELSATRVEG